MVTIMGAPGAVFPAAQVEIRNLYTEQTVYVSAGLTGAFTAEIFGPGNTPFWISPSNGVPNSLRYLPGSLPGGPGTIIYGAPPEARTQSDPVTQIIIDGQLSDWSAYPQADIGENHSALVNRESLYIAIPEWTQPGSQLVLTYTIDDATYELVVDPALPQAALLRQIAPFDRDRGTVAASAVAHDSPGVVEVRIPLGVEAESAVLERVVIRSNETILFENTLGAVLPVYDEHDGIVYPGGPLAGDVRRFSIAGPIAQGESVWSAIGRIETLSPEPGSTVMLELDATLNLPNLPESLVGLSLIGEIGLQPVVVSEENVAALLSNNGWSNVLTASGLAVDNLHGDLPLGSVVVPAAQVVRRGNQLVAGFRFKLEIPQDLPDGLYVPTFQGRAQIGDSDVFAWEDNGVFGTGTSSSRVRLVRLPLVMNIGLVSDVRMLWTLFYDHPSDGSRGVLPEEDHGGEALSNRVRFNSPTYVLPPGSYPIEPYLPNLMPNDFDVTAAPLLPVLFPGGRLSAAVTYPDGTVDNLPDAAITQNRLSTSAFVERERFGGQSPVDVYRLTTGNPSYTSYGFNDYGEYEISLTGGFEDIYGNRYEGGGTFELLIAELLDLTPGVLPGTPFHVGDAFFPGGHVSPGVPAGVDIRLRVFTSDGQIAEHVFEGVQANRYGYFLADEAFRFDVPGEYIVDYEARYEDLQGRLWAASLRSAGVIASPQSQHVAHGRSGVPGYTEIFVEDYRPAWFTSALYPPDLDLESLYYPYFGGDVAIIHDGLEGGIHPVLTVQDLSGSYESWLRGTIPGYVSSDGLTLDSLAAVEELPVIPVLGGPDSIFDVSLAPEWVVNEAHTYISAVRPDVTVRQYVAGSDHPALPLYWDSDDPYNQQIGAGVTGDRPGDYFFLFGGTVVRNAEANIESITPYASLAIVGNVNDTPRIVPPYRGATGGPGGEPMMEVHDEPVDLFFHPTGMRPGQVMTVGDRFAVAGQAAPTLESLVSVVVTSPEGEGRSFSGETSPTGYFYDPAQDFAVDEVGVWTVQITVTPAGFSSAGRVEPPLPEGGVLGTINRTFSVFVLPENAPALEWSQEGDIDTEFRAGIPFNFGFELPVDWSDPRMFYAVTTSSYVLDSGEIRRAGNSFLYQYSPALLANTFPNLEFEGGGEGASAADVVTLTFVLTGIEPDGTQAIRSRTFTIMHDRLISFVGVAGE